MGSDERERALDLLASQHSFPGPFGLRVLIAPHAREGVLGVLAEVAQLRVLEVTERASSQGNWVSLRVSVHAETPGAVLDAYAALRVVPGVAMTL